MPRIPLASAEKLLKKNGQERISEEAKEELRTILEDEAKALARKASAMAKHSKRKTILESDISFVLDIRRP